MNVAILHYASPPIIGGVEQTIYYHARYLAEAGHVVRIITGAYVSDVHEGYPWDLLRMPWPTQPDQCCLHGKFA